jgi:hypothetical protein
MEATTELMSLFSERTVEFYINYARKRICYKAIPWNRNKEQTGPNKNKWTNIHPLFNAPIHPAEYKTHEFLCIESDGLEAPISTLCFTKYATIPWDEIHIISSYKLSQAE